MEHEAALQPGAQKLPVLQSNGGGARQGSYGQVAHAGPIGYGQSAQVGHERQKENVAEGGLISDIFKVVSKNSRSRFS